MEVQRGETKAKLRFHGPDVGHRLEDKVSPRTRISSFGEDYTCHQLKSKLFPSNDHELVEDIFMTALGLSDGLPWVNFSRRREKGASFSRDRPCITFR